MKILTAEEQIGYKMQEVDEAISIACGRVSDLCKSIRKEENRLFPKDFKIRWLQSEKRSIEKEISLLREYWEQLSVMKKEVQDI